VKEKALIAEELVETPAEAIPKAAAHLAEYIPPSPPAKSWDKATPAERIQEVQDSLLARSAEVIDAAISFQDIEENDVSAPPEWVEKYGQERAERRFRVAKAAWRNGKAAPVGLTIARDMYVGITKAQAAEKSAPTQLNVAIQMNVQVPDFEEIDVE
jgi:hypothetical protein